MTSLILSVMTLTVIAFGSCQILSKVTKPYHYSLLLVLLCLGALATGPCVFQMVPEFRQVYIASIPTAFFLLVPSLWVYHCGLTSRQEWRWGKSDLKHFWPVLFAVLITLLLLLVPSREFDHLFFSAGEYQSDYSFFVAKAFFVSILIWCTISIFYLTKILKQTLVYRKALKGVFAEKERKSLYWIEWLVGLTVLTWVYSLAVLTMDNQSQYIMMAESGVFFLLFLIVWVMTFHGVSQEPGFASVSTDMLSNEKPKYVRSALNEERAKNIAKKLEQAITDDRVFLDDTLTLYKLAKHLGVPSQYLSQTLNQTLNTTFFDYVNKARIDAAKPMLLNSSDTVLDVAMAVGFNARSSFYKAFKLHTGLTPSEFKKQAS